MASTTDCVIHENTTQTILLAMEIMIKLALTLGMWQCPDINKRDIVSRILTASDSKFVPFKPILSISPTELEIGLWFVSLATNADAMKAFGAPWLLGPTCAFSFALQAISSASLFLFCSRYLSASTGVRQPVAWASWIAIIKVYKFSGTSRTQRSLFFRTSCTKTI